MSPFVPASAEEQKIVKDLEQTFSALERIRQPFEPQIDELFTYIFHGRRKISDKDTTKGLKTGIHVYDGTALGAANLLTDGLTGYTISKSFKWFGYTLPHRVSFSRTSLLRSSSAGGRRLDSLPEVKQYLEELEEAMYSAFLSSNLYDMAPDFVRDAVVPGTVTIDADEDIAGGRVVFTVPHFRECYIAENYLGMVDTNFRVRKLTLEQLVQKFGLDQMTSVDQGFMQAYEKNRHDEREVLHARYPRASYDPKRMDKKNKPWASMWILRNPHRLLEESGTSQQRFVTWRWRKNNDEWYGRSPAWDAFIDHMTANQAAKSNLLAAHKMVDPPMIGLNTLRGAVRNAPGGWTWVNAMSERPQPLQEGIQLPFGLDMQDRLDRKIRDHFHVDFFLMLSQAAMQKIELTATQVLEMSSEKAAVLGPRIGRMETEALSPIHDLVFDIESRAGRLPMPPQVLLDYQGKDIEIDYLGPLAQAQRKLFRSQGIQQGLDAIVPLAQVFPEIRDIINADNTARDLLLSRGFPQRDLHTEDVVTAIRQTRQEAETQRQGMEQAVAVARSMPAAGKEIAPNSLAGMMAGMGGEA